MVEQLLELRYPQLAFLLKTHKKQEALFEEDLEGFQEDFSSRVVKQNPSLILLIGMSSYEYFFSIESWLNTHPHSDLLIFEENLDVIAYFLSRKQSKAILKHPQVHLKYVFEPSGFVKALQEAVKEYPSENILIEIAARYKKKYSLEELSLAVLRKATITSSLFNEDIYYHLLFRNLLANFHRLPSCFYADALRDQFKDIPAVICGAGPSLAIHIPILKQMEHKALIIAGGSTLAALSTQGVNPHIGLALDPNPEEYDRLKVNQAFEVPILFGNRVMPAIFRTSNGPTGYMRTFSGGLVEQALEERLELTKEPLLTGISQEGLSVTVMCFAAAVHFGCNPIFISGVDLAYVDKKRYAEGIVVDPSILLEELKQEHKVSERLFSKQNRSGEEVYTTVKWIMEAATIEEFANNHPDIEVFDCIEKGLGFNGLEKISLNEAMTIHLQKEYDLRNFVHMKLQEVPNFFSKKEEVVQFIQELKKSFEESQTLVNNVIGLLDRIMKEKDFSKDPQEHSLMTLYTMDLKEQLAFEYFLSPVEELMVPLLSKEFRFSCIQEEIFKRNEEQLNFLQKQYKHFEKLITHYLSMFSV